MGRWIRERTDAVQGENVLIKGRWSKKGSKLGSSGQDSPKCDILTNIATSSHKFDITRSSLKKSIFNKERREAREVSACPVT